MYLEWLLVAGRFPAIGARVFARDRIGSYSVAVVNTALFSRLRNHPALSLKVTVASTTTRVFSRAPIRPRRSSSITGSRLNYRRRPQPFSRFVAFFRSRVVCCVSSFFVRDAVFFALRRRLPAKLGIFFAAGARPLPTPRPCAGDGRCTAGRALCSYRRIVWSATGFSPDELQGGLPLSENGALVPRTGGMSSNLAVTGNGSQGAFAQRRLPEKERRKMRYLNKESALRTRHANSRTDWYRLEKNYRWVLGPLRSV